MALVSRTTSPHVFSKLLDAKTNSAVEAAVLRLHMQFVTEVIEAGDFCPWARGARLQGHVDVSVEKDGDLHASVLSFLEASSVDVAQIVVPDATSAPIRWRERVTLLERAVRREAPHFPFAFAAFHPQHPGRPESIGGAIGLLRRSPFPMLQLVRLSALDDIRQRYGELADRIPEKNQERLQHDWTAIYGPIVESLIAQALELNREVDRDG